ncbi:hypothetical protein HZA99_03165 [Candidatus Woesearchaeota archaeon]|nr:hypothetical protein [Candidatus Woesearchaeota archaeon]
MEQTPESLEVIIGFLAEVMDIRERQRGFYILPPDEQTSDAKTALETDLRRRVAALSDSYAAQLEGTPEKNYLYDLKREYGIQIPIDEFIKRYNLSTRLANVLFNLEKGNWRSGTGPIRTVSDLDGLDIKQVLNWPNMGKKTFRQFVDALEQEGYHLKGIEMYRERQRKRAYQK